MITHSALLLCLIFFCLLTSPFSVQNSYIGYEVLQKLAIPQPKQYLEVLDAVNIPLPFKCSSCLLISTIYYHLQARYPDGIALEAVFVHRSVVDMLDAAVGDAIENGQWYYDLSLLYALMS